MIHLNAIEKWKIKQRHWTSTFSTLIQYKLWSPIFYNWYHHHINTCLVSIPNITPIHLNLVEKYVNSRDIISMWMDCTSKTKSLGESKYGIWRGLNFGAGFISWVIDRGLITTEEGIRKNKSYFWGLSNLSSVPDRSVLNDRDKQSCGRLRWVRYISLLMKRLELILRVFSCGKDKWDLYKNHSGPNLATRAIAHGPALLERPPLC